MFKNIRVGEKVRLQFRWETYNLFNHTNFNDIDTNLAFDDVNNQIVQTNARFGQPTSTRPPRVMQGVAANHFLELQNTPSTEGQRVKGFSLVLHFDPLTLVFDSFLSGSSRKKG